MKRNSPIPLVLIALLLKLVVSSHAQMAPVEVAHINDGGYVYGVAVSGNHAYLANGTNGMRVYDISNPANPIRVGQTNDGRIALAVVVSGNYAYLANDTDGLRIYSLGASAPPQLGIALTSTNAALLSWPAPSTALVVQRTAELGATNWVDLTNTPTVVAGRNQVVLPLATGNRFYRLRFP